MTDTNTDNDSIAIKTFATSFSTKDVHGNELKVAEGLIIDFSEVSDDEPLAIEKRQKALVQASKQYGMNDAPYMVFDIGYLEDLDLIVDGEKLDLPPTGEKKGKRALVKVMVPCKHIVDITNLKPKMGESVIRANPVFPSYRWFQAVNLLLSFENKTEGRVVPFPIKAENENGEEETIYHVLRTNKEEYEAYQRLLMHAVANDGVHMGFYHAAKFSYEILHRRGYSEVTEKVLGEAVTKITMMGVPVIRGVLIQNSTNEDYSEGLREHHFIYAT